MVGYIRNRTFEPNNARFRVIVCVAGSRPRDKEIEGLGRSILGLTVTITATDGPPRIQVNDREYLQPATRERIVELGAICSWLVP